MKNTSKKQNSQQKEKEEKSSKRQNDLLKYEKSNSNGKRLRNPNETNMSNKEKNKISNKKLKTIYSSNISNQNNEENECSICLEQIKDKAILKKCTHYFCKECIEKWSKYSLSCPLCKANINKYIYKIGTKKVEKKLELENQYEILEFNSTRLKLCTICSRHNNDFLMLTCYECGDKYCHTYCIQLDKLIDNEWFCDECDIEKYNSVLYINTQLLSLSEDELF